MANESPLRKKWHEQNALIYAGMAAVSMAGVYEIFGREQHNWADTWGMCCFAAAVPFLTLRFLMIRLDMPTSTPWVSRLCSLFDLLGLGGAVLGFTWVIGSFYLPAMGVFWGTMFLAVVLLRVAHRIDRSSAE